MKIIELYNKTIKTFKDEEKYYTLSEEEKKHLIENETFRKILEGEKVWASSTQKKKMQMIACKYFKCFLSPITDEHLFHIDEILKDKNATPKNTLVVLEKLKNDPKTFEKESFTRLMEREMHKNKNKKRDMIIKSKIAARKVERNSIDNFDGGIQW